ncbi:hypothetical protein V6N12_067020 [Hibiscus sabdariffa]|uniref:Uncharacterized protein n=1 Tax=Hibiscus sabdariffa TaxID=183260 RepID=A0ABR2BL53_9ROSI
MATVGLDGFEVIWVAGSMVLLAFPDVDARQHLLSQEVLSTWFGRLEVWEVELVRVPIVEQREVLIEAAVSEHSQELWGIDSAGRDRSGSLIVAGENECVVHNRGGVRSAGDVECASVGIRSREGSDSEQRQVSVPNGDYLSALVGCVGAAVAPVIGVAQGGARKVKFVNSLVEALGSPVQQRVIVATHCKRDRGRPAKGGGVVDVGMEVVNESLTDSDIQARQRYLQLEAEATIKLGNLIGVCTTSCEQDIIQDLTVGTDNMHQCATEK